MSIKKRKSYSLKYKLDAIEYAQNNSISLAAEAFGVHRNLITKWKNQKVEFQSLPNQQKHVKKERSAKWPELEVHLKEWVLAQRKQGFQVSGSSILREARAEAIRENYQGFKGSHHWVFNFMKRNKFAMRAVTSVGMLIS